MVSVSTSHFTINFLCLECIKRNQNIEVGHSLFVFITDVHTGYISAVQSTKCIRISSLYIMYLTEFNSDHDFATVLPNNFKNHLVHVCGGLNCKP